MEKYGPEAQQSETACVEKRNEMNGSCVRSSSDSGHLSKWWSWKCAYFFVSQTLRWSYSNQKYPRNGNLLYATRYAFSVDLWSAFENLWVSRFQEINGSFDAGNSRTRIVRDFLDLRTADFEICFHHIQQSWIITTAIGNLLATTNHQRNVPCAKLQAQQLRRGIEIN